VQTETEKLPLTALIEHPLNSVIEACNALAIQPSELHRKSDNHFKPNHVGAEREETLLSLRPENHEKNDLHVSLRLLARG
jgi:hypothetical protein